MATIHLFKIWCAQIDRFNVQWQQRVKEVLERDALLQSYAKVLLQHIKLRATPAQPVVAPAIAPTAKPSPKYDKAELQAKARQFAEEFVRRREAQKAHAEAAKVSPPPVALVNAQTQEGPAPSAQPPSITEPAPAPRRARVLRNAASLARYAATQPLLGLCPTSMRSEQLPPGFS